MGKFVHGSKLTANDSSATEILGSKFAFRGAEYRYIKIKDLAVAANQVVEYSSSTDAFTKDRSGGSSIGRTVAGVAVGTVSAGNYGYVQVSGTCSALVPAAGVLAAGDLVTAHATSDGAVVKATTATFKNAFAVALGADTATTSVAGVVKVALIRV